MIDTVLVYLLVALFFASVFLLVLSDLIIDWLRAREKRKKAAAKAAADSVESVAKPA